MEATTPTPGGLVDHIERQRRYVAVATWLEGCSDEEILELDLRVGARSVWSTTGATEVAGQAVFVKRVPLTAREVSLPYSTRNHFGLPTYYQYGVGSAGFGAFRELAGLVSATTWVLDGQATRFPLLYHARILPGRPGPWRGRMTPADYVAYWGGNEAVGRLVQERSSATHELWLFLEHLPHMVSDWLLPTSGGQVDVVLDQLCEAVADLRSRGVVHFDAHLANVMTDGSSVYLADFGLVCAAEFDLSATERDFLDAHLHYDLGIVLASLGLLLTTHLQQQSVEVKAEVDRLCGITEDSARLDVIMALIDHARGLADLVALTPEYVAALERYRDVNAYMYDFITQMQARAAKDATYDDHELLARLRAAGAAHLG